MAVLTLTFKKESYLGLQTISVDCSHHQVTDTLIWLQPVDEGITRYIALDQLAEIEISEEKTNG